MPNDMEDAIKRAEEEMEKLNSVVKQDMNSAEQEIKKGIVQTAIWILLTVTIYFIWGTTWFFWVSFAFNVISIAAIVFTKVMVAMNKVIDKYENEAVEYDEKQKVLETLLNTLANIGEGHGEVYDTECREQMSKAVFSGFIFENENHVLPKSFGLYDKEGNSLVKKALTVYIKDMLLLAKGSTVKERLEMFQDEVYSKSGESQDEFFGWVDVDDLVRLRNGE